MKRFLIILTLSLFAMTEAFGVDRNTALRVAQTVLYAGSTRGDGTTLTLLWNGLPGTKANGEEEAAPFYVFGKPEGGFAIVAGYEAAHPVLGYSLTGRFDPDNLPPQVRDLLEGMATEIISAMERGILPGDTVRAEWAQYLHGQKADDREVVLKTAKWNQGEPYNMFCPIYDGNRTVTGCTNTAAAIVMRYHKWPQAGIGDLPGYVSEYNQTVGTYIDGHTLGHKYDWDKMPEDDLYNNDTVTFYQQQQVAQLMYDLGIMNQSSYGYSTSAALHVPEFVAHFNYDPSMQCVQRSNIATDYEWESLIKNEIDSSRPVLYSASLSGTSGHGFVIDGYKGRYFHTNFGWGGFNDAFLLVSPIDDKGSELTYYIYSAHWMYIGLQPDRTGNGCPILVDYVNVDDNFNYKSNTVFYATWYGTNRSLENRKYRIAFCLVGSGEDIEEIISEPKDYLIPSLESGSSGEKCLIKSQLRGVHSIRICYMDESEQWRLVPSDARGRFQLSYDHRLRSLSKLEYSTTDQWERVSIRIPLNARFVLLDDKGERVLPIFIMEDVPDSSFCFIYDGWGNHILRHKKGTESHHYTVIIYDFVETVEIGISL